MKNFSLLSLLLVCSSCGDSSGLFERNEVSDIDADPSTITLGQNSKISVYFSTQETLTGVPKSIDVSVKIPAGLKYLSGTGRLSSKGGFDTDKRLPDSIISCGDFNVLLFRFSSDDLSDVGFQSPYRIRFDAQAASADGEVFLGARASDDIELDCGGDFSSEEKQEIFLIP